MSLLFYYIPAFTVLAALVAALVLIGKGASDCPRTGRAARMGGWIVATGFAAVGAGIVAILGATLTAFEDSPFDALAMALGFAAIALGLGFYIAAGSLRDILDQAARQIAEVERVPGA